MAGRRSPQRAVIRHTLEGELNGIDSREDADRVVAEVERLAGDETEAEVADMAEADRGRADDAVRAAAARDGAAGALVAATRRSLGEGDEQRFAQEATEGALTMHASDTSARRRSRELLRDAVVRRLRWPERVDARVFGALHGTSMLPGVRLVTDITADLARHGAGWVAGAALAWLVGVPGAGRALPRVALGAVGGSLLAEDVVKRVVRRRRRFARTTRQVLISEKPRSWSSPSGHASSAFAAARALSSVWPTRAPLFYGLAAWVALSRVARGDHLPSDVLYGAALGIAYGEGVNRLTDRARVRIPRP